MSDYTYTSYTTYMPSFFASDNEDEWMRHIFNGTGGTIEDPVTGLVPRIRDDDTFQPSEIITVQTSPDSEAMLSYEGTVLIEGTLHPVFEDAFGNIYVFSQSPDRLPSTLDVSTISSNAEYAFPHCFVAGTRIATPDGPRPVESLRVGDLIQTADGRAVPVRWVGSQSVLPMFASPDRLPVVIEAGALGAGCPARDLTISADHAVHVKGLLINAGVLANGATIRKLDRRAAPQEIRYFNIETDAHEVILAEGVEVESFVDYNGRSDFDNYRDYLALYGFDRVITEMPLPRIGRRSLVPRPILAEIDGQTGVLSEYAA